MKIEIKNINEPSEVYTEEILFTVPSRLDQVDDLISELIACNQAKLKERNKSGEEIFSWFVQRIQYIWEFVLDLDFEYLSRHILHQGFSRYENG